MRTKIRGYVFDGYINRKAVIVRDFGSIMPIEYSLDCGDSWNKNEKLSDEKGYYELMLSSQYPPFHYGGEYQYMSHRSYGGVSFVSNNYKSNYMGARSHKHFFPMDVKLTSCHELPFFEGKTNAMFFDIGDERFELSRDGNYKLTCKCREIGYHTMCSHLKKLYPDLPFYEDNILKDLLCMGF